MNRFKFIRMTGAICALLTVFIGVVLPSLGQNYSLSGPSGMTSNTWSLATSVTNQCTNSTAQPLKLNAGAAVMAQFACGADTNTAPYVIGFDVSPDNTYWTADSPLRFTVLGRGTTNTYCWTNFSPATLDNVRYIRPGLLTPSSTNGIYVTNLWLFYRY